MLFLAAPKIYWALLFFILDGCFFSFGHNLYNYRNKTISSMSIPLEKTASVLILFQFTI